MKKILIIEDDAVMCLVMTKLLLADNFELITAENGLMGLYFANNQEPDLIICDVNLPYLNGYEILKQLKTNLKTVNIPFIFVTSETGSNKRSYALQLGANDYLTKPLQFNELRKAIAAQLQIHQLCTKLSVI